MPMPLHFIPAPIAFVPHQGGAVRIMANDGDGAVEVTIEMTVLENLSAEKNLSKDAALTALVKNQSRLAAIASQIYERTQPDDRRIVISSADLISEPR
jgi:hypothetical protein